MFDIGKVNAASLKNILTFGEQVPNQGITQDWTELSQMSGISSSYCYGSLHLGLPHELDMRAAAPLKATLAKTLPEARPVVIEAGSVERISTACIQIIIAFVAAARKSGLSVTLRRPSPAFVNAFNDLGLCEMTNDWNVEA